MFVFISGFNSADETSQSDFVSGVNPAPKLDFCVTPFAAAPFTARE